MFPTQVKERRVYQFNDQQWNVGFLTSDRWRRTRFEGLARTRPACEVQVVCPVAATHVERPLGNGGGGRDHQPAEN